jgi:hypothetical protein
MTLRTARRLAVAAACLGAGVLAGEACGCPDDDRDQFWNIEPLGLYRVLEPDPLPAGFADPAVRIDETGVTVTYLGQDGGQYEVRYAKVRSELIEEYDGEDPR